MSIVAQVERINENIANTYNVLKSAGATMPAVANSDNLPATAQTISAVLYGKEQNLTEAQKAQARENIGVVDEICVGNGDMPEGATIQILTDGSDAEQELKDELKEYIDAEIDDLKESGEFDGKSAYAYAQDGGYTGTEEEFAKMLAGDVIPTYWEEHISEKIADIKAVQRDSGKDCFSFVVLTDMHYPSNEGKKSPLLAKKIMDACNIKYALNCGDTQTRGCHHTKEDVLDENRQVADMFTPIKDRLLSVEGNHDGSYYWSGGSLGVGTAYVKQLNEKEMFEEYYRANCLNGDVHFDTNSNAFYVDDVSNKVRYIGLNTMNVPNSKTDVDGNGIAVYPKMHITQFLQAQYDFLCNEALATVPSDVWSVVVFGHSGIYSAGDYGIMVDVLAAYKHKTNCVTEYAGVAEGGPSYDNLAEPLHGNTTDTTKWVNGYRLSTSTNNPSTQYASTPTTLSNIIDLSGFAQTEEIKIRIKGVTLREASDRVRIEGMLADGSGAFVAGAAFNANAVAGSTIYLRYDGYEDGVYTYTRPALASGVHTVTQFRFSMPTPANEAEAKAVIITVNDPIVENEHGYDYISVNHDFTNAKGNFIAYFHGHEHQDKDYTRTSSANTSNTIKDIATRCDGHEESDKFLEDKVTINTAGKWYEREQALDPNSDTYDPTNEQSFDVFTINKATRTIHATKIGAGDDRTIKY